MCKEILLSEFKEIDGYNRKYIISKEGIVINTHKNKIVKYKTENRKGVKSQNKTRLNLSKGRRTDTVSVESLILKTFGIDITCAVIDLHGEEWKDINGYEGSYQISSHGRIKSLSRVIIQNGKERIQYGKLLSSKRNNGNGYNNVLLCDGENGYSSKYIHILVAEHFIKTSQENH